MNKIMDIISIKQAFDQGELGTINGENRVYASIPKTPCCRGSSVAGCAHDGLRLSGRSAVGCVTIVLRSIIQADM